VGNKTKEKNYGVDINGRKCTLLEGTMHRKDGILTVIINKINWGTHPDKDGKMVQIEKGNNVCLSIANDFYIRSNDTASFGIKSLHLEGKGDKYPVVYFHQSFSSKAREELVSNSLRPYITLKENNSDSVKNKHKVLRKFISVNESIEDFLRAGFRLETTYDLKEKNKFGK
jgi:hypothetical protein